ncbi:helix-turn-helix domain-containing protein [Shewanella insulae]|uniref:helix-turn-helix domain-containing protein n=1 Tax=Shewanella insulae TaxID=2681496 RepID=UPI001EFDD575|nr:helix-turn-helix domain-containing protein [Shewanella insulae]MCG9739829.1 helix-turn-helix domain-containing protein [Shewanella insulae]
MHRCETVSAISYSSPRLSDQGIEILDLRAFLDSAVSSGGDPYQAHRVGVFCIIYIEKGKGEHLIDFQSYQYQAPSIIFVNKAQIHAFDQRDCVEGKLVVMTQAFFSASSANIRTSYFVPVHLSLTALPVLPLSHDVDESFQVFTSEMSKSLREGSDSHVIVQLLLSALMLKFAKHRESQLTHISGQQKERFKEFLHCVDSHYTHVREASLYADLVHSSYKCLNELCKSCCGHTAKELIDFRIILEIKRKLAMDGKSVQQVAFEMGFDDITNFIKYFKRRTGETPAAFKRKHDARLIEPGAK